ncbi:uncharacterized protein DDB_G0288805 isoform X2 [Eurosta solidaginis]|uniref:uncharacterized protein DDB_G0288805 isoform X2 n=1 Tax=Eurosta solidaginis TaxID=178769 RepID=UPI003530CF4C
MLTNKLDAPAAKMLTPLTTGGVANTKPEQHSKPILSPTRSLDEGFESDPDRVSTDSEHQTSGANTNNSGSASVSASGSSSNNDNTNNNNNNNKNNKNSNSNNNSLNSSSQINENSNNQSNKHNNNNSTHNFINGGSGGSTLAQLSSAATGGLTAQTALAAATTTGLSARSTSVSTTAADLHKQRLLTMVALPPQITRRQPAISATPASNSNNNNNMKHTVAESAMEKFHKELQLHQHNQQHEHQSRRSSAEFMQNANHIVAHGNSNNNNNKHHLGAQYRNGSSNLAALTANVTRASTNSASTTASTSSGAGAGASPIAMQRLQYQKQRQPLVASAAGHQTVHNHRFTAGGSSGGGGGGGFRRARTRAMSPAVINSNHSHASAGNTAIGGMQVHASRTLLLPRSAHSARSHSVDAISRHRHGYDPANALFLKHEGSGHTSIGGLLSGALASNGSSSNNNTNSATNTRMMNYKYAPNGGMGVGMGMSVGAGAAAVTGQALLVQPISSATLSSSSAAASLPAATTVLNPANVGDAAAAAALVAAAGGSPVIASSTNSLYTFYPAEGNLQVWQSECGDLTYKSSRNQHTHKAPVCWTQSIPRQTRRYVSHIFALNSKLNFCGKLRIDFKC